MYFIAYYKKLYLRDPLFLHILSYLESCNCIKYLNQTTITLVDNFLPYEDSRIGDYSPTLNHIRVLKSQQYNSSLLLHEFLHAVLDHSIDLRKAAYTHYQYVLKVINFNTKTHYGLTNYEEFFCEILSNSSFFFYVHNMYLCEEGDKEYLIFKHLNPEIASPNKLLYKLLKSTI